MNKLVDVNARLGETFDGLHIEHHQEIPISFTDFLAEKRRELAKQRSGELLHVASVPAVFAVKWMNEGLDVYRAPLKEIIRKIKQEGLEDFLATEKAV